MKQLTLIFVLVLFVFSAASQSRKDSITARGGISNVYFQNGTLLKLKNIAYIVEEKPAAKLLVSKARTNNVIGSIFGGVGGFVLGWQLGTAIGGGKPNWAVAGVGAGVALVSIPFAIKSARQTKQAVQIYNDAVSFQKTSSTEIKFIVNGNGLGFALQF